MELRENVLRFFPVGSISPEGWLKNQLCLQADGLHGQLPKMWPDIRDSKWIGGNADSWERVPYWLDGYIPLAVLLRNDEMLATCTRYINAILEHQEDDGWICPCTPEERPRYDMWACILLMKVLMVYDESIGDPRIETAMLRAFRAMYEHIRLYPCFNWAKHRWFEALIPLFWLYEKHPDESWLLDLAQLMHDQGFGWSRFFGENWPYTNPLAKDVWQHDTHVVNIAMALKEGALCSRLFADKEYIDAADNMLAKLDRFHGMVTGLFSGDECLAGNSPSQGTEFCAVVEMMYSLENLTAVTGCARWGDRLESLAFNALPATCTPDMTAHQYDQQVNQPICAYDENNPFSTNGAEANLFGVEPNYGCCTANFGQGWPKFAASLFMKTLDNGIAVQAYAPACLRTVIGGNDVSLRVKTDYPFKNRITLTLNVARAMQFPLSLRIPAWAEGATLIVGNEMIENLVPGEYYRLERLWQGATVMALILPMKTKVVSRPREMYAVVRGPLVYSLPIGYTVRHQNKPQAKEAPWLNNDEYLPTEPWAYALASLPEELASQKTIDSAISAMPFDPEHAPNKIPVKLIPIKWETDGLSPTATPANTEPVGELKKAEMIPYGCTMLRMTEFPLVTVSGKE